MSDAPPHPRDVFSLDGQEKAELLEKHDHRCSLCYRKSSAFYWDHIKRCSESLGEWRFQPVCLECDKTKTATESHSFDTDLLASHFERGVWESYESQATAAGV